ncbi:MAG: adenylate/guanylate cyclase domain-containing protein [Oscillospiraceae bacterium]|nr:adenylate/guanylate cyclase domain-containing protein [Oscillospiraceae bacterium]
MGIKRVITAVIFAIAAFLVLFSDLTDAVDRTAEDIFYHTPSGTTDKIKIIKIDDKSINALGDFEKWDRGVYAQLIEKLCVSEEIKPAVIGLDVIFSSENNDEADAEFVKACEEHGNVVTAFSYVFESRFEQAGDNLKLNNMHVADVVKPFPALYDATSHGFANALMDSDDGYVRKSFLNFTQDDGVTEYSLNTEIYKNYAKSQGFEARLPQGTSFSFRYSGKPGKFENVSLSDVLDGTVPAEAFDGCIVLVGAYTAGMMDSYYVPVDRGQQMYGVEIHANAVQALMEEKYIYKLPEWAAALIGAVLAGILAYVCGGVSVAKAAAVCAGAAAARFAAGYAMFNLWGISADTAAFPMIAAVILGYFISAHYYSAKRAKKRIENAFKKYVAPQVVSDIAKSGTYELRLGGEMRDIAVLFVDIRGFTPLSEKLSPEEVVEILNEYLKLTTSCIFKHDGTLDKFIGDATMAVFNAPFDTDDYVYKAVMTAWDIVQGGKTLEGMLMEKHGVRVSFGVGVNCGPAVVGNIGCDFRMDYTAIGDTVNTAARLESKAPGGTVYISSAVYDKVKDRIKADGIGEIPLKGKSNGVYVYSVTDVEENQ